MTVSYKTIVMLDGSSMDADGPEQHFEWTLEARPAGSTAMLDDPTIARPSFLADLAGEYRVSLTVGDGLKTSLPSTVKVTAENDAPIAKVNNGAKLFAESTFTLDGSTSTDPNGDPLTYQWTITSAPQTSTAAITSPTSAVATFTPDAVGIYKLALVVNDGTSSSAPATVTLDAYFRLTLISATVRDAAYSSALDRVVMIGPPNTLYLYDPVTRALQTLPLPYDPLALALAPDGLSAVVGYDGYASKVILQPPSVGVTKVFVGGVTPKVAFSAVHGGNGYGYVFPDLSSRAIQNVPLDTTDAVVAGSDLTLALRARLVPGTLTMYATPGAGTQNAIFRLDVNASSLAQITRGVTATTCGNLWITDDGQKIVTECGTLFSISNVAASDMQALGPLTGASITQHVTSSTTAAKLVTLPGNSPANTSARIYGFPSLAFDKTLDLPRFLLNGTPYDGQGAWAFIRNDNQTITVVEKAASSVSSIYGLGTFPL